ncbi:MAG: efflux RND transporter permease subunit [Labilithrix sp.]|nr:efflux RND transporter permease subunit [Labilithrix sp.]
MKRSHIIAIAIVGLAVAVAALALFLRTRRPAREEIVVAVTSTGRGADEVDALVTRPLERALRGTPGLTSVRSESSPAGARLSCSFEGGRDVGHGFEPVTAVRSSLLSAARELPPDVSAPEVMRNAPATTSWIFAESDLAVALMQIPGVQSVDVCGGLGAERAVVRVDLAHLAARGVELTAVERALDSAAVVRLMNPRGSPPDLTTLAGLFVRAPPAAFGEGAPAIRVSDVAHLALEREPPPCSPYFEDDSRKLIHVVRTQRDIERKSLAAIERVVREATATALDPETSFSAAFTLPADTTPSDAERAMSAVRARVREARLFDLRGAMLRAGGGGALLFSSRAASVGDLRALRAAMHAVPGVAWAGFGGSARGKAALLQVAVFGDTTEALERTASEVSKQVAAVNGVGPAVRAAPQYVSRRSFEIDRAAAARAGVDTGDLARILRAAFGGLRVDSGIEIVGEPSGERALAMLRLKGVAAADVAHVRTVLEPASVLRIDGVRAIELAWEVDAESVVARVREALGGQPRVRVRLGDDPESTTPWTPEQ